MVKKANIPHGFSIANIAIIILLGLIVWGIFYGAKIAPQVRSTANEVANLNQLKDVDLKGHVGWIPIELKGHL
jgi:hypothetical protein